jgi:hypothetical protein
MKCLLHNDDKCEYHYDGGYSKDTIIYSKYSCKNSWLGVREFSFEINEKLEIIFYKIINNFDDNTYITSDKVENITWFNGQKIDRFVPIENYELIMNFI